MLNDNTKVLPLQRVDVGQSEVIVGASKAIARLDDPRFNIRPVQQVASACTGAMLTACFSKLMFGLHTDKHLLT